MAVGTISLVRVTDELNKEGGGWNVHACKCACIVVRNSLSVPTSEILPPPPSPEQW